MSFDNYKNIAQVMQEFVITSQESNYIEPILIPIKTSFQEELEFNLKEFVFAESEYGICETIIFPILKEVYKLYKEKVTLWSHKSLNYDDNLCGIPDYIIAKRSPLGKEIFEQPYLITVEAKRDDFIKGWGQCLAEMVTIQKLNKNGEKSHIYGIVSNGIMWQFGKLQGNIFSQNSKAYTIYELELLLGAINYVYNEAQVTYQKEINK